MGRDASGLSDSLRGRSSQVWATGCSQGALVRSEASGGTHDGSESDLAGGNEDKEAGTPHPPLRENRQKRKSNMNRTFFDTHTHLTDADSDPAAYYARAAENGVTFAEPEFCRL